MATIYADQVSELAIRATVGGRPHVNVLHFANDEGAVNDGDKARDILNNWQDHILTMLTGSYVLTGADWRSLDRDDLNQGTLAPDDTKLTAGSGTGQAAPPNVALLVKKVTNNRQRGQRDGRMFIGGIPENEINPDGTLLPATRTFFQNAVDAFMSGVNDDAWGMGGGSGLVVLNTTPQSRLPGAHEVDLTYRTVSELIIDPLVSTQRDRLR